MYKKITDNPKERWKVIAHLIMQHKCRVVAELGFSKGDNTRGVLKTLDANEYKLDKFYLIEIFLTLVKLTTEPQGILYSSIPSSSINFLIERS